MEASSNYILIVAGGAGTRLWPLSRKNRPKQFQTDLTAHGASLFQQMVALSSQVVPLDHICIISVPEYHDLIKEQAPQLPAENILSEPALRDNGPAIMLGMLKLRQRDPNARVAILWSDHLIQDSEAFAATLRAGFEASAAYPTALVTIGAKPTSPDTGLGYIHMGKNIGAFAGIDTFAVQKFVEKPDQPTAEQFVSSGEFLWNVGYKIMGTADFFSAFAAVRPELQETVQKLESAVTEGSEEKVAEVYLTLPREAIEYLFTSHLSEILVVPADMGWSDVGNWQVLHDELSTKENTVVTSGEVRVVKSANSLAYAKDRPIMLVGMEDTIVVDSGDAILVMSKSAAQNIKQLIQELETTNPELL